MGLVFVTGGVCPWGQFYPSPRGSEVPRGRGLWEESLGVAFPLGALLGAQLCSPGAGPGLAAAGPHRSGLVQRPPGARPRAPGPGPPRRGFLSPQMLAPLVPPFSGSSSSGAPELTAGFRPPPSPQDPLPFPSSWHPVQTAPCGLALTCGPCVQPGLACSRVPAVGRGSPAAAGSRSCARRSEGPECPGEGRGEEAEAEMRGASSQQGRLAQEEGPPRAGSTGRGPDRGPRAQAVNALLPPQAGKAAIPASLTHAHRPRRTRRAREGWRVARLTGRETEAIGIGVFSLVTALLGYDSHTGPPSRPAGTVSGC